MRKRGRRAAGEVMQINIQVDARVYRGIEMMGRARGYRPSTYAKILLESAYAVQCGKVVNDDLTAAIRRAVILEAAGEDIGSIAELTGLSERTVETALTAWQAEKHGEAVAM